MYMYAQDDDAPLLHCIGCQAKNAEAALELIKSGADVNHKKYRVCVFRCVVDSSTREHCVLNLSPTPC